MASVLFAIGDYSEALKVFQAEAESQPRNAACLCNIAAIHLAMELTLQWEEMHVFLPKLPNCFALERKHKGGKKHMRDRFKGASQERGVAEELVLDQLHSMRQPGRLEFHAPSKTEQEQLCNELQLPIAAHILVAAEMKERPSGG